MAVRLAIVAAARTTGAEEAVFGGRSSLADPQSIAPYRRRTVRRVSGPEHAAVQTAERLVASAEVVDALRDCDLGGWAGRSLIEVGTAEPEPIRAWLTDPYARPHGGETLAELIIRVGASLEEQEWPEGRSLLVVAPLVARAALVHALGAPPQVIFRLDVAPLGEAEVTRSGSFWRLRQVRRRS